MSSDRRRAACAALLVLSTVVACGKRGDPLPPPRTIPQPVTDLAVRQREARALFELGHPKATVAGLPLPGLDRVTLYELLRPAPAAGQPVEVLPAELAGAQPVLELAGVELGAAIAGDRLRFEVALPEPLPDPPLARIYAVRTHAAGGETSDWSNTVALVARPAPPAPAALEARPLKPGVELTWQPVEGASAGYAVLRRPSSQAGWGAPLALVDAGVTTFLDATARYGERYVYSVLAQAARTPPIESAPRIEREVDYQDRFPPEPPAALRALAFPGEVRLLWDASPDADVAGYRLERAEPGGEFTVVADALTGVEHTDRGLAPGSAHRYRVVAVDRAGNVSEPSAPAESRLP